MRPARRTGSSPPPTPTRGSTATGWRRCSPCAETAAPAPSPGWWTSTRPTWRRSTRRGRPPPGARRSRLRAVRAEDAAAEHHHFAGASLAVTAHAYRLAGGLEPVTSLEDEAHPAADAGRSRSCAPAPCGSAPRRAPKDGRHAAWPSIWRWPDGGRAGATTRPPSTRGRCTTPRATRGWRRSSRPRRRGHGRRRAARDGAAAGPGRPRCSSPRRRRRLPRRHRAGGTGGRGHRGAAGRSAPRLGPARGKGDAMWRALSATDADVVCFLDADTADPHPHHLLGLLGPLLAEPGVQFVEGAFDRPMQAGAQLQEGQGGRVARADGPAPAEPPRPALAGFRQPLAGELGARRDHADPLPPSATAWRSQCCSTSGNGPGSTRSPELAGPPPEPPPVAAGAERDGLRGARRGAATGRPVDPAGRAVPAAVGGRRSGGRPRAGTPAAGQGAHRRGGRRAPVGRSA